MATTNNFITPKLVRSHLKDMGYDPDVLSEDTILDFVLELQELYEKGDFSDNEASAIEEESVNNWKSVKSDQVLVSEGGSRITKHEREFEKWEEELDDLNEEELLDKLASLKIARSDNNSGRSTPLLYEYEESLRPNSGFIRVPIKAKPKKCDPVARFHQHNAHWKRDPFLVRQQSNSHTGTGRWGGTPVLNELPTRNRTVKKPSTYLIPSQNKRKEVVWDIRNRMAQ